MPLEAACRRQRILQVGFESSGKIKAAGGDPPQAVSFVKNNFEEENSYNEKYKMNEIPYLRIMGRLTKSWIQLLYSGLLLELK